MNIRDDNFRRLVHSYYRAVNICDGLYVSRVFETKIKMNFASEDPKSTEDYNLIATYIAEEERKADKFSFPDGIDTGVLSVISELYFADLKKRGNEWEFAYLGDQFAQLKQFTEEQIHLDENH